jgi:hypothetical protein
MNDDRKIEQAVEVDEQDLDRAAGGISGYSQPADERAASGADAALDSTGQKSAPQDPSIGLLSDSQKKL